MNKNTHNQCKIKSLFLIITPSKEQVFEVTRVGHNSNYLITRDFIKPSDRYSPLIDLSSNLHTTLREVPLFEPSLAFPLVIQGKFPCYYFGIYIYNYHFQIHYLNG
jgi:hypothetical protein